MRRSHVPICSAVILGWAGALGQEAWLAIESGQGAVWVSYETVAGKTYELQQTADLVEWQSVGLAMAGDGQRQTREMTVVAGGGRFFRLVVRDAAAGLAPEPAEAVALFVGRSWGDGYFFEAATRFNWNGETGNWSYAKTGPDTALIVFTYDEDGNDPGIYREEVVLTFETANSGRYRYSEFYGGVEYPLSVVNSTFVL